MSAQSHALIELRRARPAANPANDLTGVYDLGLKPGECALISCVHAGLSAGFVDLLLGLRTLDSGSAFCLGLEWSMLSDIRADALRGRVGRYTSQGAWVGLYTMEINILLQQLHHTNTQYDLLSREAEALCRVFGLPGMPTSRPDMVSGPDRRKAGLVRAFLNRPPLVILENPFSGDAADEVDIVLEVVTEACLQGSGVILLSGARDFWPRYRGRGVKFFNLYENGLEPVAGEG